MLDRNISNIVVTVQCFTVALLQSIQHSGKLTETWVEEVSTFLPDSIPAMRIMRVTMATLA